MKADLVVWFGSFGSLPDPVPNLNLSLSRVPFPSSVFSHHPSFEAPPSLKRASPTRVSCFHCLCRLRPFRNFAYFGAFCIFGVFWGRMSLQDQATRRSGVKQEDAFALDEVNLFQRLGLDTFVKLSTKFYTRVYDDDQEWFRKIFANSTKEDAIRNQYEFFVQRMGGPPLYSQRKGHPALIGRHGPFTVNEQAAERWLEHMQAALNEVDEIDADSKKRMSDFFKHTAYFLVAGKEIMNRRNAM